MSDYTFRWYDFGAGWFSGICGLVVGHPLDTIKVRQQSAASIHSGSTKIIASIFKKDGVLGFYKGMLMPMLTSGVINSVYFGCYGNTLRALAHWQGEERAKRHCCEEGATYPHFHWHVFLSGCAAGLVTTVGLCPIELSKIQLQTQTGKAGLADPLRRPAIYSGTWDFLLKTFKAGGVRNLFVGLVPMLIRDVPTFGLYALAYEHTACVSAELLHTHHNATICVLLGGSSADPIASGVYMLLYVRTLECFSEKNIVSIMLAGANAGIWSWAMVVPVDVVKSRIQADNSQSPKYKGMWDCVRKSYKEDGARVFVRGFGVIVLRAMPVNAATFFGYEMFIDFYLNLTGTTK